MGKVSIKKNVKKPVIKKPRKTPPRKPKLTTQTPNPKPTTQTQTQNVVVNVGKDSLKKRKTPIKKGITTKKQEATKKAEESKKPSIVNTNIQPQQPRQPMTEILKDKIEEKAKPEKVKNNELEKDKVKEKEEEDETIFYDAQDEPKPVTIRDIRPSDVKVSDLLQIVNPVSTKKGPVEKVISATIDYLTTPSIITPKKLDILVKEADLLGENPTTNTIKLVSPLTKEDLVRNQILTGNFPTINTPPPTDNFFDAISSGPILSPFPSPIGPIPTPPDLPELITPDDNDDDDDIFIDAEDEPIPSELPVNLTPTQNNDIQTQPIQTATISTQTENPKIDNIPIETAVSVPQVAEPLQITQDPFNPPIFNPFNDTLPAIYLSSSFEEKLKQRRKEKENEKPLTITYETPPPPQTLVKKGPEDLSQFIDPKIKQQSLQGVGAFISGKPKETKQETKLSNLLNKPKKEKPPEGETISQSTITPAQKIKDLNTEKMKAILKETKKYNNTELAKILITNGLTKAPDGTNITTPKSGPMAGSNRINRDLLSKLLIDAVNDDKINFSSIDDKIGFNNITL
jgi:hypothetical protein